MIARFQGGQHPNRHLQQLWNEHGSEGFAFEAVEELEDDGTSETTTEDLKALLDLCLERHSHAKKVWR